METDVEMKETWKAAKRRLKQKFSELVDDDILLFEIKHDALLKKLQVALGKTREEVRKLIFKK